MNIGPKDKKALHTWLGAILSAFMIVYMAIYTSYKINFVLQRDGQQVMQIVKEDYYVEEKSKFSSKQGFAFAFSIIDDTLDHTALDPRIGELRVIA